MRSSELETICSTGGVAHSLCDCHSLIESVTSGGTTNRSRATTPFTPHAAALPIVC